MLQLDKHQNKVLLAMVTVLALLTGVYVFRNDVIQENRQNDLVINARTENETEMPDDTDDLEGKESSGKIDEPPGRIKVYITGQVKNPGVIEVDEGSRLIDVIELAGGALENADLNRDGFVNSVDATILSRYLLEIINKLPV